MTAPGDDREESTLGAADELPHVVGPARQWSEAYSFNLYDPACDLGGFTEITIRPNEGTMDVALSFFLPDGGFISARHVKAQSENTADLEVEGVRYTMIEPLARWRVSYDGPAHSLPSARAAGQHDAWRASRLERLIVDLEFAANHPPAGDDGDGRFEQSGGLAGEVWVSGDRYDVRALGFRGKSWGVRDLGTPRAGSSFSLSFGDDCAMAASRLVGAGEDVQRGWIFRDGHTTSIRTIDLVTETEPDSYLPKSLRLALGDSLGRRHELVGEILHVAPLPSSRGGRNAVLCHSVARFTYDGRTGYGSADYLQPLDAQGRPIAPVG